MLRDLPLSNGPLLVAFVLQYRIRDVSFPHVGKLTACPSCGQPLAGVRATVAAPLAEPAA